MVLQTCQKGNIVSRSMPSRVNINGFDRSILETSAKMGRVIFHEFCDLQTRTGVWIYRLNWEHVYVTCTDLPGK